MIIASDRTGQVWESLDQYDEDMFVVVGPPSRVGGVDPDVGLYRHPTASLIDGRMSWRGEVVYDERPLGWDSVEPANKSPLRRVA